MSGEAVRDSVDQATVIPDAPALIYAGIDEAGYGPTLGPLCVALTVFEVRRWTPGDAAPDLWSLLKRAVSRTPSATGRRAGRTSVRQGVRIAVNDSKKLKIANHDPRRHPLTHLERGVLAFLAASGSQHQTDASLLRSIGADDLPQEWYAGDPVPLPLTTTPEHLALMSSRLSVACADAGVRMLDMRCLAVHERAFNDGLTRLGSKADVSFCAVAALLRRVWKSRAVLIRAGSSGMLGPAGAPRVVIDRQGGRTEYAGLLARAIEDADVHTVAQTERQSVYDVIAREPEKVAPDHASGAGDDGPVRRCMRICFRVEAEQHHFPVALASMVAKLVRELLMHRFNRYWCERIAELKPTAGYATDARRWLADVRPFVADDQLRELIRRA